MNRTGQSRHRQGLLLDIVLDYASRGWAVFPLWSVCSGVCTCRKRGRCEDAGKHPRTRAGFLSASTDEKVINRWKWETANIGIATGAASGLVVIDIDPRHGGDETIKALMKELGKLPPAPRVKTGDGWHLYFRHPGHNISSKEYAPGIDIKADGGYVVAPPSMHASGKHYQWEVDPDSIELPNLPQSWLDWIEKHRCHTGDTGLTGLHRGSQGNTGHDREVRIKKVDTDPTSLESRIQSVVKDCLPAAAGHRHSCIFRLARKLKAFGELKDQPTKTLKPIVRQWYDLALPHITTKEWEDTWWDFEETWQSIKFAEGEGIMTDILERAKAAELPEAAQQYESPKVRLLVCFCRELQHHAGEEPFFLSTRAVGSSFGITPRHAARWLNGLVRDGILELVEKGSNTSRLASQFRYIARK